MRISGTYTGGGVENLPLPQKEDCSFWKTDINDYNG